MNFAKFKKWFPIFFMLIYGLGLMSFALIYWVNLISNNRWDELDMRIIVMVLTIGTICCLALSKIFHNQKNIIDMLTKLSKSQEEQDKK